MSRLYNTDDPHRIFKLDKKLQDRMVDKRLEIERQKRGGESAPPESTFGVFKDVVGPFLRSLSPAAEQILTSSASQKVCEHDLFFWCASTARGGLHPN